MNDVMELTIPQLEYILTGCKKNNDDMNKEIKGGKSGKMEDKDAIQYLIDSKQVS